MESYTYRATPAAHLPRLLKAVTTTSGRSAAIAGAAALAYEIGLLAIYMITASEGPFASVGAFASQALPTLAVVAGVAALFAYFAGIVADTARNREAQVGFNVFLLSHVPMIAPVTLYVLLLFAALLVSPPYNWLANTLPAWLRDVVLILGSCWWLPALGLMWLTLWLWANQQVNQFLRATAPLACHHCGHDLRSLTHTTTCPQCGHPLT